VAVVAVSAGAEAMQRKPAARVLDRLAAAFLLIVLAAGSLVLWIGIPFGLLWFLSHVTDSWTGHFVMGLLLIPLAMALFSAVLFWLNALYLRVTGVLHAGDEDDDEEPERRFRGPLELFLYAGMVVAFVSLCVWFFFYASNPSGTFW
jgi:hypothetical protein